MTKASDNQFPSVLMVNTSNASVGTPAPWNAQRLFFDADGTLKRIDSSDTVTAVGTGISNVDDVVTAATKLSLASNFAVSDQGSGEALVDIFFPDSGGSGLSTGTSFPGSPSTGDRYRRSDIDYLIFFYDGTRWLSEQYFTLQFESQNQSSSGDFNRENRAAIWTAHDIYLEKAQAHGRVSTTNNGSNYWQVFIQSWDGSYTTRFTYDTSADTAGTWTPHNDLSIGTAISGAKKFSGNATANGSPGVLYAHIVIFYRIIAT